MPSLSCEEYHDSQQLLALKIRLSERDLDPKERWEIERLIEELEKKLKRGPIVGLEILELARIKRNIFYIFRRCSIYMVPAV